MAIVIDEMKLPITPQEALSRIQRHTDNFGVFFDLDRILEYRCDCNIKAKQYEKALLKDMNIAYGEIKDETIIKRLLDLRVPEFKLMNAKKKLSIDKNIRASLLNDANINEDVYNLVDNYNNLKASNYRASYFAQYLSLPLVNMESFDNHRMVVAHPEWVQQATSRIGARNPSIQNIDRELKDIITSPKGYRLIRADSGQIEPRITFSWFIPDQIIAHLITAYGDAYAGIAHYAQCTDEELKLYKESLDNIRLKPLVDDFKIQRQNYKTLVLSANYGSQLKGIPSDIAENYKKRIIEHPTRIRKELEVKEYVNRGGDTFYGAFGTAVTPQPTAKYRPGDSGWKGHLVRCGLNNPIQTTASELMCFSVDRASNILSKAKDSHICFYKHDEGCFYVNEDEYDDVAPQLAEVTAYNVKNWIPIGSDVEEGRIITEGLKYLI